MESGCFSNLHNDRIVILKNKGPALKCECWPRRELEEKLNSGGYLLDPGSVSFSAPVGASTVTGWPTLLILNEKSTLALPPPLVMFMDLAVASSILKARFKPMPRSTPSVPTVPQN